MANPRLSSNQLAVANNILAEIRGRLQEVAGGDREYLWALRRKIAKELTYDERSYPSHRNRIKTLKRQEQNERCTICQTSLPEKYCVLDRLNAIDGYTVENTRLICQPCDSAIQKERGYA